MRYIVNCSDKIEIQEKIIQKLEAQKIAYKYPFLHKPEISSLEETLKTFQQLNAIKNDNNNLNADNFNALVPISNQQSLSCINSEQIVSVCKSNPYMAVQMLSQAPVPFVLNNNIVSIKEVANTIQNLKDSNIRNLTLAPYETDQIRKIVLQMHEKVTNATKQKLKKRKQQSLFKQDFFEEENKKISDYNFLLGTLHQNPDKTLLQLANRKVPADLLSDPAINKILNVPFLEAYKKYKNLTCKLFFTIVSNIPEEEDNVVTYTSSNFKISKEVLEMFKGCGVFDDYIEQQEINKSLRKLAKKTFDENFISIPKDSLLDQNYKNQLMKYQIKKNQQEERSLVLKEQSIAQVLSEKEMTVSKKSKRNNTYINNNAILSSLIWLNSIDYEALNNKLKYAIINTVDKYFNEGHTEIEQGYLQEIDKLTDQMYLIPFNITYKEFGYDKSYFQAVRFVAYVKIGKLARQYVGDFSEKKALIEQLEKCFVSTNPELNDKYNTLAKMLNKKIIAEKLLQKTSSVIGEMQANKFLIKQQMRITRAIANNQELHKLAEGQQIENEQNIKKNQLAIDKSNQLLSIKYYLNEISEDVNIDIENIQSEKVFKDEIDGDIKQENIIQKTNISQNQIIESTDTIHKDNNLTIILNNMKKDAQALQELRYIFKELETTISTMEIAAKNQKLQMDHMLKIEIKKMLDKIREKGLHYVTTLDFNTYENDEDNVIQRIKDTYNLISKNSDVMEKSNVYINQEEKFIENQRKKIVSDKRKLRQEALQKRKIKDEIEAKKKEKLSLIKKIRHKYHSFRKIVKVQDEFDYHGKKFKKIKKQIEDPNNKKEEDYEEEKIIESQKIKILENQDINLDKTKNNINNKSDSQYHFNKDNFISNFNSIIDNLVNTQYINQMNNEKIPEESSDYIEKDKNLHLIEKEMEHNFVQTNLKIESQQISNYNSFFNEK